jgi:hypothetical protein
MPSPKLTTKRIGALENLCDVVMEYKVELQNSLRLGEGGPDRAPPVLHTPILAILAALAECEDAVD